MPGHLTPHSALWQEELPDKEVKPDFGLSGALAAETNTVKCGGMPF